MFLKIYFFIFGSARLCIKGFGCSRLLGMLIHNNIYIWNIKPVHGGIELSAGIGDTEEIKRMASKAGCRSETVKQEGLVFFLKRLSAKYFFVLGAIFFAVFLMGATRFIWLIEVRGNFTVPTGDILEFCRENNLTYGTPKSSLDTNILERDMKNRFDELTFVSVTVKGTRALISVSEKLPEGAPSPRIFPADVVSSYDALVTSVTVRSGRPLVTKGMSVAKGDILISSEVEVKAEQEVVGTKIVRAEGEVYGRVRESYTFKVPYRESVKIYSKNKSNEYEIEIFNKKFRINSNKGDTNRQNCDKIESKNQLRLYNDIYLPFIITKTEYLPYNVSYRSLDPNEARQKAQRIVSARIINTYPADSEIEGRELVFSETEDGLDVRADITSVRQIGIQTDLRKDITKDGETEDRG